MTNESNDSKFVFWEQFFLYAQQIPVKHRVFYYEYIMNYGLYGTEPDYNVLSGAARGVVQMATTAAIDSINRTKRKYQASVTNGKKGGNPNFSKGKANPYYKNGKKITQDNPTDNREITQDNQKVMHKDNPHITLEEKRREEGYTLRYNLSTDASADGANAPQPSAPKLEPYTAEQAIADIKAKAAAREERERAAAAERERIREEQFQAARAERERKIQEAKAMLLKAKEAEVSAG